MRDLDQLQEEMVATGVNVEDGTGEGRKGRGRLASLENRSVYSYPERGRLFCLDDEAEYHIISRDCEPN